MTSRFKVFSQSFVLVLLLSLPAGLRSQKTTYSVMTYNIRLAWPKTGETSWPARRSELCSLLRFYEPDLLGMQEVLKEQLDDIDSALPGYDYVGVGRDDGKMAGEYSPLFYKKDEFRVLTYNTFWLSPTPDKPSKGWDAAYKRICTYALLESKDKGQKFWVFNTHFDNEGKMARERSVKMIDSTIQLLNTAKLPVILMGDLNMEQEAGPIHYLASKYNDARKISEETPFGPSGSFNDFKFDQPVTRRIDYIFTSKGNVAVEKYGILSNSNNLHYPSDHLPVLVKLHFEWE